MLLLHDWSDLSHVTYLIDYYWPLLLEGMEHESTRS